jgi:hypothetical protein
LAPSRAASALAPREPTRQIARALALQRRLVEIGRQHGVGLEAGLLQQRRRRGEAEASTSIGRQPGCLGEEKKLKMRPDSWLLRKAHANQCL